MRKEEKISKRVHEEREKGPLVGIGGDSLISLRLSVNLLLDGEVTHEGEGVEEVVLRDPEELGHLLIVNGELCVGNGNLAVDNDVDLDVLNGLESLLPELELDGSVKLGKADGELEVDVVLSLVVLRVHLHRVGLMSAEQLSQAAELVHTLIVEAELKGVLAGLLVEVLEAGVVAEDLEDGAIGLPEEAEPGSEDLALKARLRVLASDGAHNWEGSTGLEVLELLVKTGARFAGR